ncbi:Putative transposase, partial (plasmid) [Acinetobacter nosocomialis 28F]
MNMNENIASEIEARNAFENKYGLVGSLLASGNYSSWAQRLKRVFNIDIETCSGCGGA